MSVRSRLDRRGFLRGAVAAAAAAASSSAARGPFFHVPRRPRLRVLGTHVTLRESIRRRAEEDLGIDIEYHPGGDAEVLQRASTRPDSFDVFEQWSNTIRVLWQAGTIQAIDTSRLDHWSEVNGLTRTGRLARDAKIGRGDSPHLLLHVQADGSLGERVSNEISFLPYVHNVDSFGYRRGEVPEGEPYETESWGWLLDDRWRGRVALCNEPTIGLFDAALAAQARGLVKFDDIGAMTRAEVDQLFDVLIEKKREGQFYGVWRSVPESIEFVRRGKVVVESMFSPAAAELGAGGTPVHYAAPREGYRAWHGVMCLSSQVDEERRDAAYRFMNWWLSGWPGALIARQGYYISVPQRAREFLAADEWDYWYEGKPAARDLPGPDGRITVKAGECRRGGAYQERFSNVAVWNSVMDTYEYSMLRWSEFLSA
ncbi:MAG: extracellular solute-binding protein [Planctomycetes bacterium]|nr:extracellular solute-binding protein [Planctomycetota bacterium]